MILICPLSSVANEPDSLKALIEDARDDTNKVKLLIRLSELYPPGDEEQALTHARSAYVLSHRIEYQRGLMLAGAELGKRYKSIAEFDSAMIYYELSIRIANSLNDTKPLAIYYNEYGSLLRRKGYYSTALEYHRKSLRLSRQLKDTLGIANASVFAAMILHDNLEYDTAINYYYMALRMYEALHNERNIAVALINIGDVALSLDEPDKALSRFREGLSLLKRINDLKLIGLSYNKIGTVYSHMEDYDSAIYYYNQCKPYYDSIGNNSGLAHLNINVGNVYLNQGRFDEAEVHYNKAISAFRKMGFQRGYLNALMSLAGLYRKQGKNSQALEIYFQCKDIATQVNPQSLLNVYLEIVDIYKTTGNSVKALEYQDKYIALNDSVYHLEKVQAIADTELKYEKEKDQARILAMEKESLEKDMALERRTRQRNSYLFGGTGAVLIFVFLFSYVSQRTRKNRIIAEQRIRQLEEEKKLLAARSIVEGQEEERKRIAKELHDGLGVLLSSAKLHFTTIRDKSPETQPLLEKATRLLEQASGDVRRISHNMMPGLLTKYGLFEAVQDLIEQVDEMKGLSARIIIEGEQKRLNENTEIMLYRVVQEMVNNSLKHAGANEIVLKINILSSGLELSYSDDGSGFDVDQKLKLQSLGLTSIQSRIKYLGGVIKMHSDQGKGTSFNITIPFE